MWFSSTITNILNPENMKISAPHFGKYLTGDAIEYARLIVTRCRERQPPMSPTEAQVNALETAVNKLAVNYKRELGNDFTNDLTALDMERDNLVVGIRTVAEGQSYSFSSAIATAASQVLEAIDQFGPQISKLPYEIETTTIVSLLNRIDNTPALTAAMATLNLTEWVPRLRTVNDRFHQLYSARTGNITDNDYTPTMVLRKNLLVALRDLFSHLNAHYTLTNDPNLLAIITDINSLTARFNLLVNKRLPGEKPDAAVSDGTK